MNKIPLQNRCFQEKQAFHVPRSPKSRRGFMTLALILCLILALTVMGVLWNYQYLTIQNLELECSARAAIQAGLDCSLSTPSVIKENESFKKVLELNTARQTRNTGEITVTAVDSPPTLTFSQPRKLGVFKYVFDQTTREKVEGTDSSAKSFTQTYEISGTTYKKKLD